MRYLALFWALLKMRYIYLKRYHVDTISMIVTMFLVFLIVFYGATALLGGAASPGSGETLEGLVVGFMVWTFALLAYSTLSWAMIEEGPAGDAGAAVYDSAWLRLGYHLPHRHQLHCQRSHSNPGAVSDDGLH